MPVLSRGYQGIALGYDLGYTKLKYRIQREWRGAAVSLGVNPNTRTFSFPHCL